MVCMEHENSFLNSFSMLFFELIWW